MNEDALLDLLRRELPIHDPSIIVGSGDDCAIVKQSQKKLLLKTDATIEDVHFTAKDDLSDVGWKALCRPLSDFAAMGAIPRHVLITVAAPSGWSKKEWLQLTRGFGKGARAFGVTIIGGEITHSPTLLFLSVCISGVAQTRSLLRSNAKPGDLICVTGKLGGSFASKHHLRFTPRLQEGKWLAAHSSVHAMMDLSDGLGSDLPRLARASHCSFTLHRELLPCREGCTVEQALCDGEDYELLFTLAPRAWSRLHRAWQKKFPQLALTQIGCLGPEDQDSTAIPQAYDHLVKERRKAAVKSKA